MLAVGSLVPHGVWRLGASGAARAALHGLSAHPTNGDDVIRKAVLCSTCDAVFASTERLGNFQLIEQAHAEGWTSTYLRGQWLNACPECNDKERTYDK